jgi:hypothetical protein
MVSPPFRKADRIRHHANLLPKFPEASTVTVFGREATGHSQRTPTARKTTGFLAVADFASSTHSTNRKTRCGNHWHIAGCRMSFLAG